MTAELTELLLEVLAVWAAAMAVGVPVYARLFLKVPTRPAVRELDFDAVDRRTAHFLRTRAEAVIDLGFEEPSLVELPAPGTLVKAYMIVLVNRPAGDGAAVTVVVGGGPVVLARGTVVEFGTEFDDGGDYETACTTELPPFPPSPGVIRTLAPSLTDPAELYALHRFVTGRHPGGGARVVPFPPGGALGYVLDHAYSKLYDAQVRRGLLYVDGSGAYYRPTLRGACRMAWGLVPPVTWFRRTAIRRRERKLLAEWEEARRAAG
jgi:hypothetical protein